MAVFLKVREALVLPYLPAHCQRILVKRYTSLLPPRIHSIPPLTRTTIVLDIVHQCRLPCTTVRSSRILNNYLITVVEFEFFFNHLSLHARLNCLNNILLLKMSLFWHFMWLTFIVIVALSLPNTFSYFCVVLSQSIKGQEKKRNVMIIALVTPQVNLSWVRWSSADRKA